MLVRNGRAVIAHIVYALALIYIRVAPLHERREVLNRILRLALLFIASSGQYTQR